MSESRKLVMGEFWKQSVTTLLVLAVVAILVMLSGYSEVLAGFTNFFRNPVNLSIFFPFIGAVVLMFIDHRKLGMLRGWALAFTTIPLIIVLGLWLGWWSWIGQIVNPGSFLGETMRVWGRFVPGVDNFNYFLDRTWIDLLRVHYIVGLDGLSFPMFLLTAFISALACIASFGIKERVKEYFILYLLLVGGMLGVFAALDYFLFYVFWEISLVPMYFLIGIWGGPRRMYAAIKFFLYTLFGSVFMLVGIIIMFLFAGVQSFSMIDLAVSPGLRAMPEGLRLLVFGGFFLAFSIKVPLFPFHTWLPDAHVEAPTPISVILAAILLKMGAYGYMRVMYPSFPDLGYYLGAIIGLLAVISIIYGALVAMVQPDLKKLVAYSSVSHGLHHPRYREHERRRLQRRGDADGRARPHHRRAVLTCRRYLRPDTHQAYKRPGRLDDNNAPFLVHHVSGVLWFAGIAGAGRLLGRVPHHQRRVHEQRNLEAGSRLGHLRRRAHAHIRDNRRYRNCAYRRLYSVDA
jgi:hypothetical protein